jgi:hypothetical protein
MQFTIEVHLLGVKICITSQHGESLSSIDMMTGPPYYRNVSCTYRIGISIYKQRKKKRKEIADQGYTEPAN